MQGQVPGLTTDEAAAAFLDQEISGLDSSPSKPLNGECPEPF